MASKKLSTNTGVVLAKKELHLEKSKKNSLPCNCKNPDCYNSFTIAEMCMKDGTGYEILNSSMYHNLKRSAIAKRVNHNKLITMLKSTLTVTLSIGEEPKQITNGLFIGIFSNKEDVYMIFASDKEKSLNFLKESEYDYFLVQYKEKEKLAEPGEFRAIRSCIHVYNPPVMS